MIDIQKNLQDVPGTIADITATTLHIQVEEVTLEKNFVRDLGADSLNMPELFMEFEEQFGIEDIPSEVAENLKTVRSIVEYIQEHTSVVH